MERISKATLVMNVTNEAEKCRNMLERLFAKMKKYDPTQIEPLGDSLGIAEEMGRILRAYHEVAMWAIKLGVVPDGDYVTGLNQRNEPELIAVGAKLQGSGGQYL